MSSPANPPSAPTPSVPADALPTPLPTGSVPEDLDPEEDIAPNLGGEDQMQDA